MTLSQIRVDTANYSFDFILREDLKQNIAFHLGAFFSKAVLNDDVFFYPRERRVAVLTESPIDASYRHLDTVVRWFPLIFTHQRALIAKGAPFVPLMFGTNWLGVQDDESTLAMLAVHPGKSEMVSFIGSLDHPDNGAYRFRREVAQYALQRGDVECFGAGIRPVVGKHEAIEPFRFSIAMENAREDYYFSEKLIDCLLLETVPIYYGCPGIGELFDDRGMLQFNSLDGLAAILDSLTPELYDAMYPFALKNKQKTIAERWHNHAGLFDRIAHALPGEQVQTASNPLLGSGPVTRGIRKLWEIVA